MTMNDQWDDLSFCQNELDAISLEVMHTIGRLEAIFNSLQCFKREITKDKDRILRNSGEGENS